MIYRTLKSKLRTLTVLALVFITILQSASPAFADINAGSNPYPSKGSNAESGKTPSYSGRMNLAVMLYDGEHKEFILDRDKLTASVKPNTYGSFPTQDWANEYNENYVGMSLNRAYAQIFRRTNVAWNAAGASESLLLFGGSLWNNVSELRIGAEGNLKKAKQYINAHSVKLGSQTHWSPNMDKFIGKHLDRWGGAGARPNGLYKDKLKTYLNNYFKDPEGTTPKPDVFIKNLVDNATAAEKVMSQEIWEYITSGAQVAHKKQNPAESPGERWRNIFESSPNRFKADEVFIGKGYLYEGDNKRIGDWNSDPRVAEQVVSYLDTLLSLSVLSDRAGLTPVKEQYKQAAMDVFGKPGAYATKPQQMVQSKTVIFDTWTNEAFTEASKRNGGSIGTYTEFWAAFREAHKGDSPKSDWRSLSQFNDFATQPLASKSKAGELWRTSGIQESTDRIALRLFTLDPTNPNRYINDSDADVYQGGIFLSGRSMYGVSGAHLGSYRGDKAENLVGIDKMSAGLKYNGSTGPYLGIDPSLTSDIAGGQFAIYMFAHATPTPEPSPFVHNIYATPKDLVVPRRATLDQDISVLYKVGNKHEKSSTTVDQRLLDDFIRLFDSHATDTANASVELQTRTYMTKQVTHHKLDTLWLPASGKPETVHTPSLGANKVGAEEDLPPITTAFGTTTIPKATFNNIDDNLSWANITTDKLKDLLLNKSSLLIELQDEAYRDTPWDITPAPEVIVKESGSTVYRFYPGYAFYLRVRYEADTEFRIKITGKDGKVSYVPVDYSSSAKDPSVVKYTSKHAVDKIPSFLCKTIQNVYEPTRDSASFKYREEPRDDSEDKSTDFIKESMPFAVYSSSPEAYAELKNWGVASYNEPNDGTHLGDGRSPVDTDLGVRHTSNGSNLIAEDYEAMAGVPTTEKLYLAVGGSEFIIDLAVQYVPNETAVRTYHSYFAGVKNQFNYKSPTGAGGDTPEDVLFADFPTSSSVGASITGKIDHTGGTITYTYSDQISASGSAEQTGGGGSVSGDWTSLSATSAASCGDTTTGKVETVPDAGDVQKFNDTMADIEKWVGEMSTWISSLEHTSGSDKKSRPMSKGELGTFIFNKSENSGEQAASGSFSVTPPSELWKVDDGTETEFNLVTFSGGSMSVTNPRNLSVSASDSCIIVGDPPVHTGDNPGSDSDGQGPSPWSVTLSFTIRPHVMCGPDCGHELPAINDIWQQSFNYDYLKIIGLSVLRLDQGAGNDPTNTGLNALIGTNKLGVKRQTYFSSPSMSISQANIFNYMGLQTDGKQDVNKATNEYFRSIAYGLSTAGTKEPYQNTKSSEANRVQYFMANEDGKVLSAKGTDTTKFPRYQNEGNKENKVSFSNEIKSTWGSLTQGIVNAGDYVKYEFGTRSNLSDGTSRGYEYNMDKSTWVENKDGSWRGKAAYDLPWAKGFIYDGVKQDGTIDATGYSVSRSLRNSGKNTVMGGISQGDKKGWDGTGMNLKTLAYQTKAYEEPFTSEYYKGQKAEAVSNPLTNPAVRDWGKANRARYSDTRNTLIPGGTTMPGAEKGDWAPKDAMAKLWNDNGISRTDDRYAQTQPFNSDEMLYSFTQTANDGGVKIRATSEYKLMKAKRDELVFATVLSDALVLDLPTGLQPIIYHYKNASKSAKAHERLPDTRITFNELWLNNPFSPNGWTTTSKGTPKDGIIIGSYNGDLSNPRITNADLQHRLRDRADKVPYSPTMLITTKDASIEAPTGVVGKELGAVELNGVNINRHLGFNNLDTRVLSVPVVNKAPVGTPINRTLLYNISPIVLSADNREYNAGEAEVFWETIVQWKDSSNHDYYGKYVTGDNKGDLIPSFYLPSTHFVRHPELLGNYGQKERAEDIHTLENGEILMEDYFIDGHKLEAYGAGEARLAQAEQFANGFGITGYNYDTTGRVKLNSKTHANMYNPSDELTGLAKGTPYITESNARIKLGVPYILQGILTNTGDEANPDFKTELALTSALKGTTGASKIAKTGYIQRAAYTERDAETGKYRLNNVVVHNVLSAKATQIMPIAEWRDQRILGQSLVKAHRDERRLGAPSTLDYSILDCKYNKPLELLELDLIGSGNSAHNSADHQITAGNINFNDTAELTGTGLTLKSPRAGLTLKDMGADYYKSLDYQITSTITYSPNTGEQMLFSFQGYGITLNTATKKLFIRKADTSAYVEVDGIFNSGDELKVRLGSANAALSTVWINGSKKPIYVRNGDFSNLTIGSNHIGSNFYIGTWTSTTSYAPKSSTRYLKVLFERLAGSHEHTALCTQDGCTEPHHTGKHYENDWLCYSPDLDHNNSDPNFVQNSKVNTKAAEFVSLDWDYTLYADSIDTLRSGTSYQLSDTASRTGLGYYNTNSNGEFDAARFIRGKYVKFPWYALYDGILYAPGDWIVLGDRGTYSKDYHDGKGTGTTGSYQETDSSNLYRGQQLPYNVQNWTFYDQEIYHDLYKSFYDFYVPLMNDELSLANVDYAVVAVNASDDRDLENRAGHRVLSAVSDLDKWLRGGIADNRVREFNMADVGAAKRFYVDLVGRIGGLVMHDTTDVKYSDTFKKPITPEEETITTYTADLLSPTPLLFSKSITTDGRVLSASNGLPARAKMTSTQDWVSIPKYEGGNSRKFVITVTGNNLNAGELLVDVFDKANGDYTLRLADMEVNKKDKNTWEITCTVKETTSAVVIQPRYNLLDNSMPSVYVTSMSLAIGGAGFGQGLTKVVDSTKQNFYITDLTDVRGVFVGSAKTQGRAVEGHDALELDRYQDFTTKPTNLNLGDWLRLSDATQVRQVLSGDTHYKSGRKTPEYGTRAVSTYGTRPWVQQDDPLYLALAGAGGKAIIGPLTSNHNVVEQYRKPQDQLSVGSHVFYDITTTGNYFTLDSNMTIIPTYYLVDTTRTDANGAVALIPVDVYQFSSTGEYQPVNIFGAPYGGFTPKDLDKFNQYRLSLNWEEEAVGELNRRMVTNEESLATQAYADLFTTPIYNKDPYEDGDEYDDFTDYEVVGRTESIRQTPSGVMPLGGSQYIYQDYRTQTFIGSNYTYGVEKSGGNYANATPEEHWNYIYWQVPAQRWHTTLGLPSDAIFVPLQQDPVSKKFNHVDKKDIVANAIDITENLIIGYIDTYAEGKLWTLHYGHQGLQRYLALGNTTYKLPINGPSGPAQANPYPGQGAVGTDYYNGGIPFVLFGGSKVEGQADIIKTN